MGKPKFSRKKYETPSHPWQEDRIKAENELIKKYGLKNKREIWKADTTLKGYRSQARTLLAKISSEPQAKKESDQLLMHLTRMNILPAKSTLDDVLALETESILSRRLQTLAYLKGLASTPTQARQLISHGHIAISGRKVDVPGYMVTKDEENEIGYTTKSPMNDTMHPARPRADFKSGPVKKPAAEKPKEEPKEAAPSEEAKPETPKEEQTPSEEKPAEETPSEPPKPETKEEDVKTEEPPTEQKPAEKPSVEEPKEETPPPKEEPETPPVEKPAEEPKKEESKEEPLAEEKKEEETKKTEKPKEEEKGGS